MIPDERRALEALRELPVDDSDEDYEDINLRNILDGSQPLDISHAGGEFQALARDVDRDVRKR
jgi:hypothetical protein